MLFFIEYIILCVGTVLEMGMNRRVAISGNSGMHELQLSNLNNVCVNIVDG